MAFTFAQIASWFSNTTPRTLPSVSWGAGDEVIVIGGAADGNTALSTPTVTGLTFSLVTSSVTGSSGECSAYLWRATAGSSGSGTISIARTGTTNVFGAAVWVRPGSASATVTLTGNLTESAYSQAVSAGDDVILGVFDWNATTPTKTPATGSGTATERVDTGDGSNYGIYLCDWQGTAAGTFSFGPNNYTSLKISQVGIVLRAASGSTIDKTPADPVGATDSASVEAASARTQADPVGATDSATQVAAADRTAADPVGVTDAATADLVLDRAPADPVGVTDAVAVAFDTDRAIADPAAASDTASADLAGSAPVTPLDTFALSTADPQDITITGATAGRDLWLIVNCPATIATPAGWELTTSRVATMATYIYRLPASSHTGGSIPVTLDLSTGRAVAVAAFETPAADTGTTYASLVASPNSAGSTAWGTFAHTFTTRAVVVAIFAFHQEGGTPPTFAADGYDHSFAELADTGWAGTGASGDEAARVMLGAAAATGFTADGVTLTLDAAGASGSAVGFLAFDLDPTLIRVAADPVGVTDTMVAVATAVQAVADPVGGSDSTSAVVAAVRAVADPVGATDSVTADLSGDSARTVTDPVGATDTAAAIVGTVRAAADPVGATDAVTAVVAAARDLADPVGVTDTGSPQTLDISDDVTDPVGVTDSASRVAAGVRAPADPVGVTDSVTADLVGSLTQAPADPVGVTDAQVVAATSIRTVADPVGVTDAVSALMQRVITVADLLGLIDSATVGGAATSQTVADPVGATDAVTAVLAATRAVVDAVGVTDSASWPGMAPWSWLVSDGAGGLVEFSALLGGVYTTTTDVT